MNRTFEQIQGDFDTLLQQLVTLHEVVAEVIFGRGMSDAGSPYLRYYIRSVDTRHVSQRDYRRGWGFQIEIVQKLFAGSERQNEIDLGNAIDKLFELLEGNWDLSGDIIDDPAGSTSEETRDDGRVVTASFLAVPRTYTSY